MCFFYFKPHKHIALHQIHKIMFFLATSYDPFKLQRVSIHTDFIKTQVRMITHRQDTHTHTHTQTHPSMSFSMIGTEKQLITLHCHGHCFSILRETQADVLRSGLKARMAKGESFRTGQCYQSPFKASHVTRQPSLKRFSGIQVQLLSLWMGKHQTLQNCLPSLRLNVIFEITNEIWQLYHRCCLFCSNSIINVYLSG